MLPIAHRLRRSADFSRAYSKGRAFHADMLVLYAMKAGDSSSRFGFVVSGKMGKSVVRNRIKRMLRAAAAELISDLPGGFDFIVAVKRKSVGASYWDLRNSLLQAFKKSGILAAGDRK